jgi:hypothetical protein
VGPAEHLVRGLKSAPSQGARNRLAELAREQTLIDRRDPLLAAHDGREEPVRVRDRDALRDAALRDAEQGSEVCSRHRHATVGAHLVGEQ